MANAISWKRRTDLLGNNDNRPLPKEAGGDGVAGADWYLVTDEEALVHQIPLPSGTAANAVEALLNTKLNALPATVRSAVQLLGQNPARHKLIMSNALGTA